MSGDLLPEPEPEDGDSLRAPPAGWSDAYLRGLLRLARARLDEFRVPLDPGEARSWASVLAITRALISEVETRAALYREVAEALDGAECPTCRRPLEEGDDATTSS